VNTLVETLIRSAEADIGSSLGEVNESLAALGWEAAGSTAPPYCRHWAVDGVTFNVFGGQDGWCGDALFKEVYPDDLDELGSEAVDRACEAEEGYFNETMTVLLERVSGRGVVVESTQGLDIDGGEFVSSAEWRIGLSPFIMGVANADPDLLVSVLARFCGDSRPV
jgi:hypothetical protein